MKLFTFYGHVPDLPAEDEIKLILLWRERWKAAGWETFVLSAFHAQQHPLYSALEAAVKKLPSSNPQLYEFYCWIRWLALAQIGGGWFGDYDCFPVEQTASEHQLENVTGADTKKIQILQTPCCPSLVYCSPANAERFCRTVIDRPGLGNRPQGPKNAPHFSDQYALEDLVMEGADWIQVRDVVKLYSDKDWEKAPVVHFANAVCGPKKLIPRWRHIPELLK